MNPVYEILPATERSIVTVQEGGQATFWDLQTLQAEGEIQSRLPQVQCAAYSDQAGILVLGSRSGSLELWDVNSPTHPVTDSDPSNQGIHVCCLTPDAKLLITSGYKGIVHFWESKTLRHLAQGTNGNDAVLSLAVSPDGRTCLTGTRSGCVHVWDVLQRRCTRSIWIGASSDNSGAIVELHYLSNNDQFIAATRRNGISVWSLASAKKIRTFSQSAIHVKSGACSPDGSRFVAGDADGRICVWDALSCGLIKVFYQSRHSIRSVACRDVSEVIGGDWMGKLQVHGARSVRFPDVQQGRVELH